MNAGDEGNLPQLSGAVDLSAVSGTPDAPAAVPSVAAITQRFLVHSVNLTPEEEDGSRILALHSRGGVLIEASLGPDVWQHIKEVVNAEKTAELEAEKPEDADA
jgi:hypothetical protein